MSRKETAAVSIDALKKQVTADDGNVYSYDQLVVATGLELNFDKIKGFRLIPGAQEALDDADCPVTSIYSHKYAEKT